MQLTKDDIKTIYWCPECKEYAPPYNENGCCLECGGKLEDIKVINFLKFQQVVEFYKIYKNNQRLLNKDKPDVYTKYVYYFSKKDSRINLIYSDISSLGNYLLSEERNEYNDWLFNYCFVEGLK